MLAAVGLDDDAYSGPGHTPDEHVRLQGPAAPAVAGYPCSRSWAQRIGSIPRAYGRTSAPTAVCGYTPAQLRSAYGVRGYTGRGATIAIVLDGHLSSMLRDANRFFAAHGTAGFAPGQYREDLGPGFSATCGSYADLPEEPLDVETAHIIAPSAKVLYVAAGCGRSGSQSGLDFLDAETRIVDRHLADVETDSFSTLESGYTVAMTRAWSAVMEQGAAEGIGFNFDSGDGGDDTNNDPATPPMVTFPASDPWATAVGGTTLEIGRSGSTVGELGWGDTIARQNRAGSRYLQKPPASSRRARQVDAATCSHSRRISAESSRPGCRRLEGSMPANREVPDVAADASPITGWLIGYTQPGGRYHQIVEGGTSGSSPIIAALEADAKQVTGRAVGFANPTLYLLRRSAAIRDIVAPRRRAIAGAPADDCFNGAAGVGRCLITLGLDGSLHATSGFDDVTGVGAATSSFIELAARVR